MRLPMQVCHPMQSAFQKAEDNVPRKAAAALAGQAGANGRRPSPMPGCASGGADPKPPR